MRWWLDRQLVCRRRCSSLFVLWLLLDGSYRLVSFLRENKTRKKRSENPFKIPPNCESLVPSIESSWSRWIVWVVVVWCVYEIPLFGFAYSVTVWCWWLLEFIWKDWKTNNCRRFGFCCIHFECCMCMYRKTLFLSTTRIVCDVYVAEYKMKICTRFCARFPLLVIFVHVLRSVASRRNRFT